LNAEKKNYSGIDMTEIQLLKDLIDNEDINRLELKKSVNQQTIAKIICGFLNGEGGIVILGVDDDKQIVGITNGEKKGKSLENYLKQAIIPEAPVSVSTEKIGEKQILILKVWSGSKQPYIFDGNIYFRRASQTFKATSNEISELIHNRQLSELHWERQVALSADINDLDASSISETMKNASKRFSDQETYKNELSFLSHYGLYNNSYLTNAAVVLFGLNPVRFLPQCRVQLVVMPEGKTGGEYLDQKLFEGNLFNTFNKIQDYFKNNIELRGVFNSEDWRRKDIRKYPLEAVDEGVLNALIHRDYSNPSSSVLISIFHDKLEIKNYGRLPDGWTISDLKRDHLSLPKNPDIAHICFLNGWIEKLGRGTLMIIKKCQEYGLKKPEWTLDNQTVTLTIYSNTKILKNPVLLKTTDNENMLSYNIRVLLSESNLQVSDSIEQRLCKILQIIFTKPGSKTKSLLSELDVSQRSMRYNLKVLIESGLITHEGSPKTGGYYVAPEVLNRLKSLDN